MVTPGHSVPREAAKRAATDNGETVTDVILRALTRYVREHPAGER